MDEEKHNEAAENGVDTSITDPDRYLIRCKMARLSMACPFGNENSADCILCFLRRKPVEERVEWILRQHDDDLADLFELCSKCLDKKQHPVKRTE